MGIYIHLSIMPHRISADEWHETYMETLALLQGYPGGMMGLHYESIGAAKRVVKSRRLEHHIEDPKKRHWHVIGDLKSKETAESFMFDYDLDDYRSRVGRPPSGKGENDDIILSIIEDKDDYCEVFSDKTQGFPYHIPVLAVAMAVETRFPKYAHVSGDIDDDQARAAQAFARSVLKREIALPLSVDVPRLFKKLCEHYQEDEALEHFADIYRGEQFFHEKEIIRRVVAAGMKKTKSNSSDSWQHLQALAGLRVDDIESGDGSTFKRMTSAKGLSEVQRTMLEGMACTLAQAHAMVLAKHPEILSKTDAQLRLKIIRVSDRQQIALTEDAWNWIDNETDLEFLRYILTLVLIHDYEETFSNMRRGLLENRRLFQDMLPMVRDEKLVAEVSKRPRKRGHVTFGGELVEL